MKHLTLAFLLLLSSGAQASELITVDFVDVAKYVGRWYQIARNPMFFEPRDCACTQQTLKVLEGGVVGVYNSCVENDGTLNDIQGTATNDDPESNSKFTVDFGLPFKGTYWIIGLDPEYRWAVVSDKNKRSLYILSKTPSLSSDLYDVALEKAAEQLSLDKLLETDHNNCEYPDSPFRF